VEIQATVTAIDKAKRTVTVKGPRGNTKTLTVGKEARNFDQVKVGDTVTLTYVEALTLPGEAEGAKPGKTVTGNSSAQRWRKPAAKAANPVVGTVTAIDKTNGDRARSSEASRPQGGDRPSSERENRRSGEATYTGLAISVARRPNPPHAETNGRHAGIGVRAPRRGMADRRGRSRAEWHGKTKCLISG
jgi:hypothetical protein